MLPYYLKIYSYSADRKKYVPADTFWPGRIELRFERDVLQSGSCAVKIRKTPGFFNPFSPNFLSHSDGIRHYCYTADCVFVTMERSIIPVEPLLFKTKRIARFDELKRRKKYGDEYKYDLYTLVIGDTEYDMAGLKDRIEHFNMVLDNEYNGYCIEELGR